MCWDFLQILFWNCGLCGEDKLCSNEELIKSYEAHYGRFAADGTGSWRPIPPGDYPRLEPGTTSRTILNL